jgi:hypothetical protein
VRVRVRYSREKIYRTPPHAAGAKRERKGRGERWITRSG